MRAWHALLLFAVLAAAVLPVAAGAAASVQTATVWSREVRGLVLSMASDGMRYVVVGTGWGDDLAYGAVYVLDSVNGVVVWNTTTEGGVSSVAVVDGCYAAATVDGMVYIKCPGKELVRLNVSNLYPRLSMRVYWPLARAGDLVLTMYAITNLKLSASGPLFEFGVEALTTSGQVVWSFNTSNFVTAIAASPNGTLVAAGDPSGVLYLYNAETGNITMVKLWHPIHSLLVTSTGEVYVYTYDGLLYRVRWGGRVEGYVKLEGAAAPGRLLASMGGVVVLGTARTSYRLDELNATKYIDVVGGGSGAVYALSAGSTIWGHGLSATYWVAATSDYVAAAGGSGDPSVGFNATVTLLDSEGRVLYNKTMPGRLALSVSLIEPVPGAALLVYASAPYQSLNCTSTVEAVAVSTQATTTTTATATTTTTVQPGPSIPVSLGVVALIVLLVVIVFVVIPLWLQSHH
ncbi:MAG: hypothetical protein GXO09_06480 [Crenarchaeota archaeon]|nr:hypothetical protein [Thermoproteota archaeon]